MADEIKIVVLGEDQASDVLGAIGGSLDRLGKATLAVAGGGLLAIGGGLTAAIGAGLSFNNSMEQVTAQLNAFTKDGAATASILDMIKDRASRTPFAFEEMASAATSLLPASKASGVALEELIAKAEILAASNPAEGLEGAAFALKEAVGGDFTSIIERFNLPRQYLNQLKEQGVPATEAVAMAMQQLGLDADLVGNLANTASGRWSTFLDTLTNLAATIAAPIFETFSAGLGQVQTVLDANQPALTAFAQALSGQISAAIQWLMSVGLPALIGGWQQLQPVLAMVGVALSAAGAFFAQLWTAIQPLIPALQGSLMPVLVGIAAVLAGAVVVALGSMVAAAAAAAAPILALVAAGAALYAAWSSNFLGIQGIVTSVLGAVWAVVSSIGAQIASFWAANGSQILATASAIWSQLQAVVSTALQLISAVVTTVLTAVAGFVTAHGAQIQQIFMGAWQVISGVVQTALTLVGGIIRTALALFQGDFSGAWESIKQLSADFVSGLIGILEGAVDLLSGAAQLMIDAVVGAWESFAGWAGIGGNVVDGIIGGIGKAAGRLAAAAANMASQALDAAKKALGIASPSKLASAEIGVPIVDGIIAGISARGPKATEAMLDLAGKLFDVVEKGVGAFADLRDLGTVSLSAITQFADAIQFTLEDFARRVGIWDKAAMSAASQFTFKAGQVVDFLAKGLDLLTGISNLTAPSSAAITQFVDALSWTMSEIVRVSTYELRLGLMAGVEFAKGAGAIVGTISAGVEGLNALADFVRPVPGVIQIFVDVLGWLVSRFVVVAGWFDSQAISAAASFATGARSALEIVKLGVEGLNALADFVRPVPGVIQIFVDVVAWLVSRLVVVAGWFSQRGLAAAAQFANSASAALKLLADGVAGMNALADFVRPAPGVIQIFVDVVAWLVSRLSLVAQWLGERGIAAAGRFADAAGKSIGLVGQGVDGFTKLATFQGVPQQAIDAFGTALDATLQRLYEIARQWSEAAITAAAAFGEGAGRAVSMIGQAVDSFVKLAEFTGVPQMAIDAFGVALSATLIRLAEIAKNWSEAALTAAATFGEGSGKAVSMIGQAVDGFIKLAEFTGVPQQAIDAFGVALRQSLDALMAVMAQFAAEAVTAAAAFGEGAGKALAFVGSAVDSFTKLADSSRLSVNAVNAFSYNVIIVISQLQQMARVFTAEGLAAVGEFATAVSKVVSGLGSAGDSLMKLADTERLPMNAVNAWSFNVIVVISQLQQMARALTAEGLAAALEFATSITAIATTIQQGLEVFARLGEFKTTAKDIFAALQSGLRSFLSAMASMTLPEAGDLGQSIVIAIANGIYAQIPALQTAMFAAVNAMQLAGGPAFDFLVGTGLPRSLPSATTNSNQTITVQSGAIQVVQQPGQNSDATANAVLTKLQQQIGMRQ